MHAGEMGGPLPQRPQMPAGTHLVVHGPFDHGMLEILEIDENGEDSPHAPARSHYLHKWQQIPACSGSNFTSVDVAAA